jgi:hypothetical protein
MADVIKNDEGQLMLLTVFLIIIGVVSFTSILNSMIFSSNLQSADLLRKPRLSKPRTMPIPPYPILPIRHR